MAGVKKSVTMPDWWYWSRRCGMVNIYGFIKYSAIHEGNKCDSINLCVMIDKLSLRTNAQNPGVVMDAGIATEENLAMIRAKGYHYLCVSRTKLKDYQAVSGRLTVLVETKSIRNVRLEWKTHVNLLLD